MNKMHRIILCGKMFLLRIDFRFLSLLSFVSCLYFLYALWACQTAGVFVVVLVKLLKSFERRKDYVVFLSA